MPDILFNGTITQRGPRKVHLEKDGYRVVLAYDYHGKKSPAWVLNALDIHPTKQKRSR